MKKYFKESALTNVLLLMVSFSSLMILWKSNQPFSKNQEHVHTAKVFQEFGPDLLPTMHPDQIILNLTEDPLESVAVNWRTDANVSQGQVQVAEATHNSNFQENARTIDASSEFFENQYLEEPAVQSYYHSAIIDDLNRGRQYVYRVGFDSIWSEWFQMTMPSPKRDGLKFIYFGDAQNDVKSLWSRVVRQAYQKMPEVDFMLHAGDLIDKANRDLEWGDWFHAGGFLNAMIPSIMTPGNHEYFKGRLSRHWKPQFNLPQNGPRELKETCYEINFPQVKLISLNAERIGRLDAKGSIQANWLDSVLTNNPKKWTAVTMHYPIFSSKSDRDNFELRSLVKPIFDKHHVDIVLQGHDHSYGRGSVKNTDGGTSVREQRFRTMYVVSISGPKMYEIGEQPWMKRRGGSTQLFQTIKIKGNKLTYEAYTATGELYDAFDLIKKSNQPNQIVDRIPIMPERLNKLSTTK